MNFSTREDVEAPIEYVFSQVSDFASMERSALRRGADVQRVDELTTTEPGMAWDARFKMRGKKREVQMELVEYDPPNGYVLGSRSPNMGGRLVVELVALSRNRTRMRLDVELEPKSLSSRLLIQSLKLARRNLSKRMNDRFADYARDMEERFKSVS